MTCVVPCVLFLYLFLCILFFMGDGESFLGSLNMGVCEGCLTERGGWCGFERVSEGW